MHCILQFKFTLDIGLFFTELMRSFSKVNLNI